MCPLTDSLPRAALLVLLHIAALGEGVHREHLLRRVLVALAADGADEALLLAGAGRPQNGRLLLHGLQQLRVGHHLALVVGAHAQLAQLLLADGHGDPFLLLARLQPNLLNLRLHRGVLLDGVHQVLRQRGHVRVGQHLLQAVDDRYGVAGDQQLRVLVAVA